MILIPSSGYKAFVIFGMVLFLCLEGGFEGINFGQFNKLQTCIWIFFDREI